MRTLKLALNLVIALVTLPLYAAEQILPTADETFSRKWRSCLKNSFRQWRS